MPELPEEKGARSLRTAEGIRKSFFVKFGQKTPSPLFDRFAWAWAVP
jgi:hypothetical protein